MILPADPIVAESLLRVVTEDGDSAVLDAEAQVEMETVRSRRLGPLTVTMADFLWDNVDRFTAAHPARGAPARELRVLPFNTATPSCRPQAASALSAASQWIQTVMDAETAAEYITAEELDDEDRGPSEELEDEPPAARVAGLSQRDLLTRIQQLEALVQQGGPQPPPPPGLGGPGLLREPVGALDAAGLDRLRSLAGPAPRRAPKACQSCAPTCLLRGGVGSSACPSCRRSICGESGDGPPSSDPRGSDGTDPHADGQAGPIPPVRRCGGRFRFRPGQRKRREQRSQRMHGTRCICPTGAGLGAGSRSCKGQRSSGTWFGEGRAKSDEALCGATASPLEPQNPRLCSELCSRGVGMRPPHVEPSASGICGQTANPLRTGLPRRGQALTSLASGRLCRAPASYVVEHSPQRGEALQCSRSSLLDSRQHCLLERPRLPRNSYEQSKQGKGWQNRGGDRPRGRCKSKGKVSAAPKGQSIGRWECMMQHFGPSGCNPRPSENVRPASGAVSTDTGFALPDFEPLSSKMLDPCELILHALDFFFSSSTGLSKFVRDSLRDPLRNVDVAPSDDLWPIPPPRWRWFGSSRSKRAKQRRRHFTARARLLQVVICSLNWKTLGYPHSPPNSCIVGSPITSRQHSVIDHLDKLVGRLLHTAPFSAGSLGRAGAKFASFTRIVRELPISKGVDPHAELADLAGCILEGLGYSRAKGPGPCASRSAESVLSVPSSEGSLFAPSPDASALGPPAHVPALSGLNSLRITASRVKWKHSPSFDPLPFMDDPLLKLAYSDPEVLRKPRESWPALVHADRGELIALARTLDKHHALAVFGADEVLHLPQDEEVGLFSVNKDITWDRLIMNPTVVNSRMYSYSSASKRLKSPAP